MSTTLSILSIFLLSLTVPTLCQTSDCKTNYFCTEDFCSSECGPKDCFVPGGEECQGILLPLYDNGNDFCSCCPWRCVQYLGQGEICSPKPTTPYPTEMCGEQLSKSFYLNFTEEATWSDYGKFGKSANMSG